MAGPSKEVVKRQIPKKWSKEEILNDYRICVESREASYLGRKEVLGAGRAKFGIFGDGKELSQVVMAKYFKDGDFRSGYYRDQTFMMAIGRLTLEQFFAQLYADASAEREPHSAGRQMSNHFATPFLNDKGEWVPLAKTKNSTSDVSPLSSQMPRALGIALASKLLREHPDTFRNLIDKKLGTGYEVCWATIGDASTAEGLFWETIMAAAVLQVPLVVCVWDDGYGISVPKKYQTPKESISKILTGLIPDEKPGLHVLYARNWNYPELIVAFEQADRYAREFCQPVLLHIDEVTQPQGHSTSGSHERYKSSERLRFEQEYCPIRKFREFIIAEGIASEDELNAIDKMAKKKVREAAQRAWHAFQSDISSERNLILNELSQEIPEIFNDEFSLHLIEEFKSKTPLFRKDIVDYIYRLAISYFNHGYIEKGRHLHQIASEYERKFRGIYTSHLWSETPYSALRVEHVPVQLSSEEVYGFMVLRDNFDALLAKYPELVIFGEDCGRLGDVNQGLQGLQAKYGEHRVFDTGIREATIVGQGIGLAMRGFRPIAEIQYLDYLYYALQIMGDDLATLRWRSFGTQKAPLIIRTRGHRLEGIWHTGSYISCILDLCRGIYVCVPRNMTQAAGMYNTLLRGDDPALIIEVLNGYRLKERKPLNFGEFTVPLGIPDVLMEGDDVTIVTYGAMVRIVLEACEILHELNIYPEVIDIQTLLPYDITGVIPTSIKKTNKVIFADEDMPGGTTAFMMYNTLVRDGAFHFLDSEPVCVTSTQTRTPYGEDGNFFCKPNKYDIINAVLRIMGENNPSKYPFLIEG